MTMIIRVCTSAARDCSSFFKFSLREGVSLCPSYRISFFAQPLLRSAAQPYSMRLKQGCSNNLRHYAVNKQSNAKANEARRLRSFISYILASGLFMLGAAYAGVPLYKMICQSTGYGGEIRKGHDSSKVETMKPVRTRVLRVRFNADTASSMQWNFKPQQGEIQLIPGETALAFYKAKNPTDKPIVGISTYNVIPFEAGQYFNKIQCFCFEEQRLNPHEEVDMPVFFYIDPEFCDDPKLESVDLITLSYTFFEAREGLNLQMPNYIRPHTL